jgi:uncharacterized surface protein with fasciclin (FAS1) repeats
VSAPSILATLKDSGKCDLFLAALKQADMADTLDRAGTYTVFAPTDEAFRQLPATVLSDLMKPAGKTRLTSLVKYHALKTSLKSSGLRSKAAADTMLGPKVSFSLVHEHQTVNGATITEADIACLNGTLHYVDAVLLPPETDLVATLKANGYTKMAELLEASDLRELFTKDWLFTVFAPTDAAFETLPTGKFQWLQSPEGATELSVFLHRHLVLGKFFVAAIDPAKPVKSMGTATIAVKREGGHTKADDAEIVLPDLNATNGVVQGIDSFLVRPK